jgi:hypothetical protein
MYHKKTNYDVCMVIFKVTRVQFKAFFTTYVAPSFLLLPKVEVIDNMELYFNYGSN